MIYQLKSIVKSSTIYRKIENNAGSNFLNSRMIRSVLRNIARHMTAYKKLWAKKDTNIYSGNIFIIFALFELYFLVIQSIYDFHKNPFPQKFQRNLDIWGNKNDFQGVFDCSFFLCHTFFFRGLLITQLRDAPSFGIYFASYEHIARLLSKDGNVESLTTSQLLFAGGIFLTTEGFYFSNTSIF